MRYRIRKSIHGLYYPEMNRGWRGLWKWEEVKNEARYAGSATHMYSEQNARDVIAHEKDLRSRKETYEEIK